MQPHQRDFLDLALSHQVLRFGEFTLKSGRVSPYFFNLGQISSGAALMRLARAYARTLTDAALIALDRQEQGPVPGQSAVEAMTADTGVPVLSLVNVDQVLDFLAQDAGHESTRAAIRAYQGQYGVR